MPERRSIRKALEKAVERLENVGWTRGNYYEKKNGRITGYCALGAIGPNAKYLDETSDIVMNAVRTYYDPIISSYHSSLASFNDDPASCPSKRVIVTAFRRALQSIDLLWPSLAVSVPVIKAVKGATKKTKKTKARAKR